MVLSSKLDFNLALETANSNFLENIFCAIETNVAWGTTLTLDLQKNTNIWEPRVGLPRPQGWPQAKNIVSGQPYPRVGQTL